MICEFFKMIIIIKEREGGGGGGREEKWHIDNFNHNQWKQTYPQFSII